MEEPIDVIKVFEEPTDGAPRGAAAEKSEIIKIIGVGGAGCNGVNNMHQIGIEGVNLVVCNTDLQALENSPVSRKIQLGKTLTQGLGAGNDPSVGAGSAEEARDEIVKVLEDNTKMVFVAAGMGGGTGTGAAPVIAKMAKDMGILTIGIVTIPYRKEGKPRLRQAIKGAEEMSKNVDSLLVVNTDSIYEIYKGQKLDFEYALSIGDNVMALAAKGLAEMISRHRKFNVDFADVKRAMSDSGCSLMGTAEAKGPDRALTAVREALKSPLLNNNNISGATHVLVNITSSTSDPLTIDEQGEIVDQVYEEAGGEDNDRVTVIWGAGKDESLEDGLLRVTVVATGFTQNVFSPDSGPKTVEIDLSGKKKAPTAVEDDEEKARTVEFKDAEASHLDNIMGDIYGNRNRQTSTATYDTNQLRPATSIPLDKLTEEELNKIEQTPAFKRRAS